MKDLIAKLTEDEIKFVCDFANKYIHQTPYVEPHNAEYLVKEYFIKTLNTKLKGKKFSPKGKNIGNSIIKKNLELSK